MRTIGCILAVYLVLSAACTIVPRPLDLPTQPSWDISDEGSVDTNGGVLELTDGGARITQRALQRYDALIALYGARFVPPLQARHGVQLRDDDIFISNDGLEKFALMNQWRRIGKLP